MGGSREMKRSVAPGFWKIPRKSKRYAFAPTPGPHPKNQSYSLGVLMRDVLGLVKTAREAEASLRERAVLVDGIPRSDSGFPVGLMDVVEIPPIGKVFRLVPRDGCLLVPLEVPETERSLKICKIKSKTTVKGGMVQYGLHDGRSLLTEVEVNLNPGDSCLVEVPSQKIVKSMKMEKNTLVMVVRGGKAGRIGQVKELKPGAFTRPPIATVSFDEGTAELPTELLLALDHEKPPIQVV
jgi:small subunit ribosomal protein S4e